MKSPPDKDRVIAFTGTLDGMIRDEAKCFAENVLGAKVANSVTRDVKYPVVGAKAGGTKLNKGRELGVNIMDEQEWFQLLEDEE